MIIRIIASVDPSGNPLTPGMKVVVERNVKDWGSYYLDGWLTDGSQLLCSRARRQAKESAKMIKLTSTHALLEVFDLTTKEHRVSYTKSRRNPASGKEQ